MAFSLIDDEGGAVPLVAVSKSGLAAWRERAPAGERDWVAATGFTGESGKLALVPDKKGGLGRVMVGVAEGEAAMWAFAGLSDTLPEGNYRIAAVPEACSGGGDPTRSALGWASARTPSPPSRAEECGGAVWSGLTGLTARGRASAGAVSRATSSPPASTWAPPTVRRRGG